MRIPRTVWLLAIMISMTGSLLAQPVCDDYCLGPCDAQGTDLTEDAATNALPPQLFLFRWITEHKCLLLSKIVTTPRVKTFLELTNEQVAQLDTLTTRTIEHLKVLQPQIAEARKQLVRLLLAEPPLDKERILQQVERIGILEIDLKKVVMINYLGVREILTPEQFAKLVFLLRRHYQPGPRPLPPQPTPEPSPTPEVTGSAATPVESAPAGDTVRERLRERQNRQDRTVLVE